VSPQLVVVAWLLRVVVAAVRPIVLGIKVAVVAVVALSLSLDCTRH